MKRTREIFVDFEPIQKEMMEGDYENLCKVFKREFGDYYRLVKE